jgi:nitrate reductase NapE component
MKRLLPMLLLVASCTVPVTSGTVKEDAIEVRDHALAAVVFPVLAVGFIAAYPVLFINYNFINPL